MQFHLLFTICCLGHCGRISDVAEKWPRNNFQQNVQDINCLLDVLEWRETPPPFAVKTMRGLAE